MIKKLFFLLLLPTLFYAQIPAYYSSVDFTQTGENLKVQLATLITSTHTTMLPYTSTAFDTWDAIKVADEDTSNAAKLLLLYGYNDTDAATNNDRSRDKTLMGTSGCTGFWNREHTFPQSLANPPMNTGVPGVSTDIHHLRAADCQFNSTRGNKIFEDGTGIAKSMSTNTWYPGDEWKGDVARMMMYLYVRYGNETPATAVGFGSASFSPLNDMPNIFLEWNIEDPVSIEEINRNNAVHTIQGNRNPFIDNPYLATLIWSGPIAPDYWVILMHPNSTTWNGSSWSNGVPNATMLAIINGYYDTSVNGSFICNNLIVNNGKTLDIKANNYIEIQSDLTINGNINVLDDGSLIQVSDTASISGIINYHRSTTANANDYVYWSSPVSTVNTPSGYVYTWDTDIANSNGGQGNWVSASNTPMLAGVGYIMKDVFTRNFTGQPRNGVIQTTITRGTYSGVDYQGTNGTTITKYNDNWNLIGNPYPSAIDAIDFINLNPNIEGAVRLWTHNTPASNAISSPFYGSYTSNYTPNDYITFNALGTVSGPSGFNGYIASGQGFMVNMVDGPATTETVTFNNSLRDRTLNNSQFYRTNQEASNNDSASERHRIWLDISDANAISVRTLVGYVTNATLEKDRVFDAVISNKPGVINIYSIVGQDKMTIQGRPVPFDSNDNVKIGVNIPSAGIYTIAIATVDGLFQNNQKIYLKDTELNIIHDLRLAPYHFTANGAGEVNDRFSLLYKNETLSIEDTTLNQITIFNNNQGININLNDSADSEIQIHDMLGRLIYTNPNNKDSSVIINTIPKGNQPLIISVLNKITNKVNTIKHIY